MLSVRTVESPGIQQIALCGELDLANAATAEGKLTAALAGDSEQVIVDLGQLEFIDSTGIAVLVNTLARDGEDRRLSFIPSRAAGVNRVLELTGVAQRLPLANGAAGEMLGAT